MIAAVLDRVGEFFDRAFVVSALFPALIAAFVVGVTLMTVLGFDSSFLWFDGLSGSAKTALGTTASGGLLLVAFLIRALRANILSLWSGEFLSERAAPIGGFGRLRQRRRYERLLAKARREPTSADRLRQALEPVWDANRLPIDGAREHLVRARIGALAEAYASAPERVRSQFPDFVQEALVPEFQHFGGNSLTGVYREADRLAKEMDDDVTIAAQTAAVDLDLFFGPTSMMRPTRLGNIIAALDAYPFRRYRIEGTLFWPYLQQVMTGSVVDDIRDQRTLLDLGLALATICMLLGLAALIGGPWLWWQPLFWLPLAGAGLLLAGGSYFVATQAALGMSRAMRAGCDLFRLEALHQLYRRHPATIREERQLWEQVGQLAAYGAYDRDFSLRPREPAP